MSPLGYAMNIDLNHGDFVDHPYAPDQLVHPLVGPMILLLGWFILSMLRASHQQSSPTLHQINYMVSIATSYLGHTTLAHE